VRTGFSCAGNWILPLLPAKQVQSVCKRILQDRSVVSAILPIGTWSSKMMATLEIIGRWINDDGGGGGGGGQLRNDFFAFCFVFFLSSSPDGINESKEEERHFERKKKQKKTFHCCSGFQLVTRIWFHFNFMLAIFPLSSILFLSFLSIVSIQTRPRITINNCYYYKYIQNIVLFPVNLIELIIHVPAHWGLSIHFCSTFHRCVINCHFAVCAVVILTFTPIMNVMSQHCWAIDISPPPLLPDVKRNENKKNQEKNLKNLPRWWRGQRPEIVVKKRKKKKKMKMMKKMDDGAMRLCAIVNWMCAGVRV